MFGELKKIFYFMCFSILLQCSIAIKRSGDIKCPQSKDVACVSIQSVYYLISKTKENWYEADRACKRFNANLVTIRHSAESKGISDHLISRNFDLGDNAFWTAGNDLGSEGSFYSWTTGLPLPFTSWSSGQPDNHGGDQNCVRLWFREGSFTMDDGACDIKEFYICMLYDLN